MYKILSFHILFLVHSQRTPSSFLLHCRTLSCSEMSTKFNEATTNFALNLLNKVAKENEDLLFSPTSITLALAMCFAGSQGKTKAQFKKAIFGDIDDDLYLYESLNELVMNCNALQGFINCNVANRLYCRKSFPVLQTYRDLLQKSFKSDIISVDFNENTRSEINQWVSKATQGKIKDIIPSNSSDEVAAQLILISALYFKAEWNEQFEKKLTTKKKFYTTNDRIVDVDMMKLSHQFRYAETDDYQALSLSYASFRASMIIVLPKEKFGLKELEENMSGSSFLQMVSSMQGAKVDVSNTLNIFYIQSYSMLFVV